MRSIGVQKFRAPKFLIAEKIVLRGVTTREGEPLHVVSHSDVVVGRIVQPGMSGSSRHDCGQMRWKFLRCRPLIETCVRPAPHRDLTVAERLFPQPLNNVVPVSGLICKRLEFATGISAAADIDQREYVSVRREVGATGMIRVRNVGRESKDDRRLGKGTVRYL